MAARCGGSQGFLQGCEEPVPTRRPEMLSIEGHYRNGRTANNALPFNRAVITGIKTVIPVVTHHKVVPWRNLKRGEITTSCHPRPSGHRMCLSRKLFGCETV